MSKTVEVRLLVVNTKSVTVTFVLEPWGETYELRPEEQVSLVYRGPEGGYPEVAVGDDVIETWGWVGSTVRLFKDDEELGGANCNRPHVPDAFPAIQQANWG
jgi:hypothetical protein